jgi:hypothetical protein
MVKTLCETSIEDLRRHTLNLAMVRALRPDTQLNNLNVDFFTSKKLIELIEENCQIDLEKIKQRLVEVEEEIDLGVTKFNVGDVYNKLVITNSLAELEIQSIQ